MRKGMALGLAGIVAASLVGAIAMFGGRVDAAQAGAAGEPQVITEHRTITKYRTETVAPDVIVVASPATAPATAAVADDEQGEDESEASETAETESPTPSPSEGSDSGSWSDDDSSSLDGHGESHDD